MFERTARVHKNSWLAKSGKSSNSSPLGLPVHQRDDLLWVNGGADTLGSALAYCRGCFVLSCSRGLFQAALFSYATRDLVESLLYLLYLLYLIGSLFRSPFAKADQGPECIAALHIRYQIATPCRIPFAILAKGAKS